MAEFVCHQPDMQILNLCESRLRLGESDSALMHLDGSEAGELSEWEAIRAELAVDGRSVDHWPCQLWSVAPGYLRVTMDVRIPGDTKVTVCSYGERFTGSVAHCAAHEDRFRVGIRLMRENGEGKRRGSRFPIGSLGLQALVGAVGVVREEIGVTDVSATGLGMRIRSSLEPGGPVMIELQSGAAFGEVR